MSRAVERRGVRRCDPRCPSILRDRPPDTSTLAASHGRHADLEAGAAHAHTGPGSNRKSEG